MKRELAYREEMVQQLQIVRGKAWPRPSGNYFFFISFLSRSGFFFLSFFLFFFF